MTYGVCLAQKSNPDFPRLISRLKESPNWVLHPHILASLIAERAVQISRDRLEFNIACLDHLEEAMGQHPYLTRPQGDPLSIDFVWATRVLNSTSTLLGSTTSTLEAVRMLAEEIRICHHIRPKPNSHDVEGLQAYLIYERMGERCTHLVNVCRNLLLQTTCEQKRTQTQLAVVRTNPCKIYQSLTTLTIEVYNFMAQKGNMINIALAADSKLIAIATKKDSSAMKTIALLTMIFLPGTFVAVSVEFEAAATILLILGGPVRNTFI